MCNFPNNLYVRLLLFLLLGWPDSWLVCHNFLNYGKLHFHVPIGALAIYEKPSERLCKSSFAPSTFYQNVSAA